jgi:hypothetical protein
MIPSQIVGLHFELLLKKNMLVELCAGNYVTLDGLINGVDMGFLKIIHKCFQNHSYGKIK